MEKEMIMEQKTKENDFWEQFKKETGFTTDWTDDYYVEWLEDKLNIAVDALRLIENLGHFDTDLREHERISNITLEQINNK